MVAQVLIGHLAMRRELVDQCRQHRGKHGQQRLHVDDLVGHVVETDPLGHGRLLICR